MSLGRLEVAGGARLQPVGARMSNLGARMSHLGALRGTGWCGVFVCVSVCVYVCVRVCACVRQARARPFCAAARWRRSTPASAARCGCTRATSPKTSPVRALFKCVLYVSYRLNSTVCVCARVVCARVLCAGVLVVGLRGIHSATSVHRRHRRRHHHHHLSVTVCFVLLCARAQVRY